MIVSLRALCLACASMLALAAAHPALADAAYPAKPIRMIIPFPPAGATDILGRAVAQKMSEQLGQQIIAENRPGAGSTIGADLVAKAAPDGYTILMTSGSLCIAANLYKKLSFDVNKSFAPVGMVGQVPQVLVATNSLPARNVRELIAMAKARPGQVNAGSQGNGTLSHMELELFKSAAGVNIQHVPYKGSSQVIPDLIAGNVQLLFDSVLSSASMVKTGQFKALGVASEKRLPALPDVPTMAESGLPGFDVSNWFAVLAPAGTPREVVVKLNAALNKALQMPDLREKLAQQGAVLESSTPEVLGALIRKDVDKWGKVIQQSGAQIE
ncbi:MAG: tripartite tricarboxylate transporter substrate binding protein [Paucimonas sp.]|nr:tripartite tricarboxylate transporter substrate binding protein [Paucimonas sp.]